MTELDFNTASILLKDIHVAESNVKYAKVSLDAIKHHEGALKFEIRQKINYVRGRTYNVQHELMLEIPIETIKKILNSKLYVSENLLKKADYEFKNL